VWFNRVHSFEAGEGANGRTVHFPRSCLHCAEPACVTVCPTGASYKRAEDASCWSTRRSASAASCAPGLPLRRREFDEDAGVMKKCTLCIDRIYNETFDRSTACRPASPPARLRRAISAISAIPIPTCPRWWRRAAATI